MSSGDLLLDIAFAAPVIEWRGPAPFFFVPVPDEHVSEIRHAAREASYGWGVVPIEATIGDIGFRTSLFPRDGGYLLPLKDAVRRETGLAYGDTATCALRIRLRPVPR